MVTAMLIEPKSRPSRVATRRLRQVTTRGKGGFSRQREERKLDRRIEYVASDWSQLRHAESAVTDASGESSPVGRGGGRPFSAYELLEVPCRTSSIN